MHPPHQAARQHDRPSGAHGEMWPKAYLRYTSRVADSRPQTPLIMCDPLFPRRACAAAPYRALEPARLLFRNSKRAHYSASRASLQTWSAAIGILEESSSQRARPDGAHDQAGRRNRTADGRSGKGPHARKGNPPSENGPHREDSAVEYDASGPPEWSKIFYISSDLELYCPEMELAPIGVRFPHPQGIHNRLSSPKRSICDEGGQGPKSQARRRGTNQHSTGEFDALFHPHQICTGPKRTRPSIWRPGGE